ncbi:hypothetical protein N7532_011316 [Penicillium argentinense]|uniref:Serine hydrolase domain-containing protein n=1 Tax=Penicillium argentinense TaxID=1131581 RepID=A0A9W9JUP7_9EURO|nr:uncharacterized protein N7532_011316 [Penicillium argentinense]KAJ5082273.1 hypothetical protein N7532_011316 [Penicillium argentinense]
MKFLCLPGAYCSAKGFTAQLGPFTTSLLETGDATFKFVQGEIQVQPPEEHAAFFGPPPYFAFCQASKGDLGKFNMSDFPKRDSAEESMREAIKMANNPIWSNIEPVLERLIGIIDEDLEIDAVIGYSEGGQIAASLLIEEERRRKSQGRIPRLKFALFFSGWPPLEPNKGNIMVGEEDADPLISIPTCHIIGAQDPFLDGSMVLYNMCEPDTAELYDHGGGHMIPRVKKTVDDLARFVREQMDAVEAA